MGYAYGENFLYDEMMVAGVGDEGKAVAEFVAKASPLEGENVPQPGKAPLRKSVNPVIMMCCFLLREPMVRFSKLPSREIWILDMGQPPR